LRQTPGIHTQQKQERRDRQVLSRAGTIGVRSCFPNLGANAIIPSLDEAVSFAYTGLRRAEHYLPVFRIAVRSSGMADMLSPFLPSKALRWNYGGDELLDTTSKKWKEGVSDLGERIAGHRKDLSSSEILDKVSKHGIEFKKKGRVFGDIYLRGTKEKLLTDVFLMEKGQLTGSTVAALHEAGKRQIGVYSALSNKSTDWMNQNMFGGNMSAQWQSRIAKFGGFIKGFGGSVAGDYVGAMNRFLKEPVPVLDRILSLKTEIEHTATSSFDEVFGRTIGSGVEKRMETVPYGRLPKFMRPYVSSPYWTANKGRMLAGITGKATMFAVGLPSLYSALDYSRSQFDSLPERLVAAPLFAAVGAGVGSLIKSKEVTLLSKLSKSGKFLGGIQRTQMGGALIGAAVGILPNFDKGLTAGMANTLARLNIATSKMWQTVDGAGIVEQQERLFPGMTSPWTAAGFAMTGGIHGYISTEIGTVGGLVDQHKIRKMGGATLGTQEMVEAIKHQHVSPMNAQQKLLVKESLGYNRTVRQMEQILAGKNVTPTTISSVQAGRMRKSLASSNELFRVETEGARLEMAGRLHDESRRMMTEAKNVQMETLTNGRKLSKKALMRTKDTLMSPKAGFMRGAARGLLAFTAVSEVGAIAAGIAGGNLNPASLIPGWLINLTGGGTRPKELEDVYTGKKEVAIQKARFWSLGRSPVEGGKVLYHRAHRLALAQTDARDVALFGSTREKLAFDPVLHPFKALTSPEFQYHREMRSMYESPTPLTGRMFSDVPIMGDVLAATIGELVKPTRAIRPNEWQLGGSLVKPHPSYFSGTGGGGHLPPSVGLGSPIAIRADAANNVNVTTRRFMDRFFEQSGLKGFMSETFLGLERSYSPIIETGERSYSNRTSFWEMKLGDPFGSCFVAGTLVSTEKGRVPIEEIRIGDKVLSLDGKYREVVDTLTLSGVDKPLLTIKTTISKFTCTDNHWIPVLKREGLIDVQARDLQVEDILISPVPGEESIQVCIVAIHEKEPVEEVYDLTIQDKHYYVVEDIAVHNTEGLRRFLIRDKSSYYNPLKNTMPSWLPGDQSGFYRNFSRGNVMQDVDEGYARLPGAGLAVLHPELEGLHPEQYPLAWRYKILSGTAYGSKEWKMTKEMVIGQLQTGGMSKEDRKMITEVNQQLQERKAKKHFRRYKFAKDALQKRKMHVTEVLEDGSFTVAEMGNRVLTYGGVNTTAAAMAREAIRTGAADTEEDAMRLARSRKGQMLDFVRKHVYAGAELDLFIHKDDTKVYSEPTTEVYVPGVSEKLSSMGAEIIENEFQKYTDYNSFQRKLGSIWETFTHNADAPITPASALSFILPFQPQSKFIKRQSPIESYARTQVYGREIQMWQRYKEDFVDSALNEWRSQIAGDFIPQKVQYRRATQDYFDKLTYLKYFMLERAAVQVGNEQSATIWADKKRKTRFGVDPHRGFKDIWASLPRSERDYYKDFVGAESEEEKQRILALVPDSIKKIYVAQWQGKEIKSLANKMQAGVASSNEKRELYALYNLRRVEGRKWDSQLQREYERAAPDGVSYADWSRMQELKDYFGNFKLPDKSWVGFSPMCDLKDVQLKYLQQEGEPIHDYGFWESQMQDIEYKPYVGPAADVITGWADDDTSPSKVQARFRAMLGQMQQYARVRTMAGHGSENKVVFRAKDTHTADIRRVMQGYSEI